MPKKQKSNSNLLEVQNAAKTMFANIRFQSIDNPIRSILLTSSVPDEGKTTTAWYLAQAAATAGNMVLLVEADMRRRSMANMLQVHPKNGLFATLTNNVALEDAIVSTSVNNLYFLDAEPSIPNPPDVLASKRMRLLDETLRSQFDYVIYDTPPVGTFVDAAVLSTVVDGVVLVVRPGRPKRTELQIAHAQLENAGANIIGICTTFIEGSGSEYYYSYYTKGGRNKRGNFDDGKELEIVMDPSVGAAHGTVSMAALDARPGDNLRVNQRDQAFQAEQEFVPDESQMQLPVDVPPAPVVEPESPRNNANTGFGADPMEGVEVEPLPPAPQRQVSVTKNKNRNRKAGISIPRGTPPQGYAGKSGIVKSTPPNASTRRPRR